MSEEKSEELGEAKVESEFIGVILGRESGLIYAVINPDTDIELENPRML